MIRGRTSPSFLRLSQGEDLSCIRCKTLWRAVDRGRRRHLADRYQSAHLAIRPDRINPATALAFLAAVVVEPDIVTFASDGKEWVIEGSRRHQKTRMVTSFNRDLRRGKV